MAKAKANPVQDFSAKLDCLPQIEKKIDRTKKILENVSQFYGFKKIRFSPIENPRNFSSLIRSTPGLEKELVALKNKTGESFLINPLPELGLLRAYVSHRMAEWPHPLKFFVETETASAHPRELFLPDRTDEEIRLDEKNLPKNPVGIFWRPQFYLGIFGENDPIAIAEVLQIVYRSFEELGVKEGLGVKINSTGCAECHPLFRSQILAYLRSRVSRLCRNCKKNFKTNPEVIFSCHEEKCQTLANNAPAVLDFLCESCKKYLRGLLEFLDESRITYFLDAKFFHGRTLYSNIIFQVVADILKNDGEGKEGDVEKAVLAEGGHLSRTAETFTGKHLEMAGLAVFLDAAEFFLFQQGLSSADESRPKVFLTQLGDLAKKKSLGLMEMLRRGGIGVREALGKDAIKSQLKVADHIGAEIALILGQKEALDGTIIVRDLDSSIQETVPQEKLVDFLRRKLQNGN